MGDTVGRSAEQCGQRLKDNKNNNDLTSIQQSCFDEHLVQCNIDHLIADVKKTACNQAECWDRYPG